MHYWGRHTVCPYLVPGLQLLAFSSSGAKDQATNHVLRVWTMDPGNYAFEVKGGPTNVHGHVHGFKMRLPGEENG